MDIFANITNTYPLPLIDNNPESICINTLNTGVSQKALALMI